jgi:hypothetical protein
MSIIGMGRNNYSYNGLISVITRKPIYRYKPRSKTAQEVVDELRESGNQRKVDSITNIISRLFSVPEVYLERNYAGPKIDLSGSSNVSMNQDTLYSDLGASSSEAVGSITVDDSNLNPSKPGVYHVRYTATDIHGFSRVIKRYVVVEAVDGGGGSGTDGTPNNPIVLTLNDTSPFLNISTIYRGKTYKFDYGGQSGWTSAGVKFTTQTTSPATDAVPWEIGVQYGPQFSYYTTWTVPETCPDTMYFFCPENGKELNRGTLTIAYPTNRALPTRYKIRWLDPDQIFPAKIDRDNIDNAFARVENIFTGRRPAAEAAELHFDTTVTMANNLSLSSAATGGPTASDYSVVPGGFEYNGWTESATITWKMAGRVTVSGNDSVYDKAGVDKNYTEMTTVHEGLHGIGVGSTTSIIGRNFNGNTGLAIRHPTDPGTEGSENYLWTGSNALTWYKTHFGSAISSDVEGVPFKVGDLSHWDDATNGGRAIERTINGKTYIGIWDEVVTPTGGDYITGLTTGMLKDIGLPINMSNVETSTPPTVPKTWAFDVGTGLTLTANTDVYTNVYTNSSLSGTNPELKIEPEDVVVLNILTDGATINVYSNTSTGNMEWDPLTTGVTSGTITIAPTNSKAEQWLYNSVFYTDGTNHGKITVDSILYREGRDHDSDGVYNNRDPQSLSFTPEYTIFTDSKVDAAMKWQGSSTGYYTANTSTVTNFPLYKESTSITTPMSGHTVSDGEPWALSTTVICGRRQAAWDQDSGIVLLNAQGGFYGNITLSTHENKDSGAFYAKFKYGTPNNNVEITTGNVAYNHYYTGFYVDYDGAQGFRMFTYDYKTDTLTQVPSSNVVVRGIVSRMPAANFEVAKTPYADRYWNGRISHVTVTTLRAGVALPTNTEVLNMIKNPDTWLTTYKVGNPFRLPGATADDTTVVTPTSLNLDVFSGYYRLDGSLILTQGTYTSPNYSVRASLARGTTYSIDISDASLYGKYMRLSTSSVYHIERSAGGSGTGLEAAMANIYTSNVTYGPHTITISAGDDTPDYLFLFDTRARYPQVPRDGPLEFTGSGFPSGFVKTSFMKRSLGGDDTTEVHKSAQATKVYYFTGLLAGGPTVPFPEERFRNDVSYDATEHFLVKN